MFSLLIGVSMLVTLSLGQTQSCKSFLLGSLPYPLDWCTNYGSGSLGTYSFKYTTDGTTVSYAYYLKAGCSGTEYTSSATGTVSMIKNDGGMCDNVALIKTYSGVSSCAAGDTYFSYPYVTDWCFEYTTGVGQKYACAGGNLTLWTYSASATCDSTTTSSMYTAYMNMECSGSTYTEVTCDASPDGGSSSSTISYNYIIYGLLFAATLVKLL